MISAFSERVESALERSVQGVARWVEEHNYRAYDPGDGQLSLLRYFTFNAYILRRILTAAVLRAPFRVRPWIGIRPHASTKGAEYMGWGYVKMYAFTGDEEYRRRAVTVTLATVLRDAREGVEETSNVAQGAI
jgi:hypothetical protein